MNSYDGIDKRIVSNVKRCARNLKQHSAFRFMDIDDVEQELMCEILECLNKFDERQGDFEHFIRKILSRRCTNLLETHTRKKRDSVIKFSEYNDETYRDATEQRSMLEYIELSQLMDEMPVKYRLLCRLFANHSIVETAKILGVSRSAVSRDLERIVYQCLKNSENHFVFLNSRGVKLMGKNLSVIETLNVKDLSKLPVFDLADLNDQVAKLVSHTKELKEKLEDALNLRFSETVQNNLRSENKNTGTTKFYESGFQITAEVPKKVTWDSAKISEIIKTISEEKRKAIVKTVHTIEERKYSQLSPEDKLLFADARTVTPGKTRFQISIPEEV